MLNHRTIMTGTAAFALSLSAFTYAHAIEPDARHASAIKACVAVNEYQPVNTLAAVEDGRGNSLVWLQDVDEDLWLCNADKQGDIFAYEVVDGDLLEGKGSALTEEESSSGERDSQATAERVCQMMVAAPPAEILASREDGLAGDDWTSAFAVFVRDSDKNEFLCNATGDAEIFAFAEIGEPLDFSHEEPVS